MKNQDRRKMARKGRINFGGLLKDEKLEKHDKIDHRHTYSEGRNSFREITLSDSEDEVIDRLALFIIKFDHFKIRAAQNAQ